MISLSAIRCSVCGSPDIVCVSPGDEPETAPGDIVVAHGSPIDARCLAHWPLARGYQQDLFGQAVQV